MSKQMLAIIGVVIALLVVGGIVLATKKANAPAPSTASEITTQNTAPAVMMSMTPEASGSLQPAASGQVKELTVEGSNFKFIPNTLTVNKGDSVKIIFKNAGGLHDFVVDKLGVHSKIIQAGATDTVSFTASKAGTFEYYCSVDGHRSMGMKGTLTVQ